jgi:hypothetical protein
VLDLDMKENAMRLWKPQLALALAAAAALALAVMLFDRRGVVNVLLLTLIGAALVGMYLLRRYARAELLYLRHADAEHRTARPQPAPSAPSLRLVEATRSDLALQPPMPPTNSEPPVHDRHLPTQVNIDADAARTRYRTTPTVRRLAGRPSSNTTGSAPATTRRRGVNDATYDTSASAQSTARQWD